jgi:hypothetical protein
MALHTDGPATAQIIQRIDAIIAELQALRQHIQKIQPDAAPATNLVEELAGALGQGSWDEYALELDSRE